MTSNTPSSADEDLLVLTCVHGNEDFANGPVSALQEQYGDRFDWIVGNPRALDQRVRYTEVDMNRVAPGSPDDPRYEGRRAYELLQIASRYPYVIDIHGTTANCGVFSIVPGAPLTLQRLALRQRFPSKTS
jgi:succinylglutamate desuccinylase